MCPCGDNTDTYVYTHVHTHVYTHVHICVCTHIHTCVPSSSFVISVSSAACCPCACMLHGADVHGLYMLYSCLHTCPYAWRRSTHVIARFHLHLCEMILDDRADPCDEYPSRLARLRPTRVPTINRHKSFGADAEQPRGTDGPPTEASERSRQTVEYRRVRPIPGPSTFRHSVCSEIRLKKIGTPASSVNCGFCMKTLRCSHFLFDMWSRSKCCSLATNARACKSRHP